MIQHIYLSDFHGCAYAMDGDELIMTPMYDDMTYDTCIDNWIDVDFTSFQQGGDDIVHAEWVRNHLVECAGR